MHKLADKELDDLLLAVAAERCIDALLIKLKELNEIVLKLQPDDCSLRKDHAYFRHMLDVYLTLQK